MSAQKKLISERGSQTIYHKIPPPLETRALGTMHGLYSSASRKLQNSLSQVPETGFEFYSDALLATAFLGTAIVAARRCVVV